MDYNDLSSELLDMIISCARLPFQKVPTEFSKGETGILYFLTENGGNLSPGELCTLMGIGSGRTADALKTLEQKKLIERRSDEYDKRKVIVFITNDGKSIIEKRRNEAREKIAETLLLLGDDDAKEFMRILSKINSFR